ncbi:hypothetical protein [Nocardia tengchongensis]|uniref:hypothetical protein n=1 Tax=Nocardia tengchongensis TaxID=2055889 RepID=UPI00365E0E3F
MSTEKTAAPESAAVRNHPVQQQRGWAMLLVLLGAATTTASYFLPLVRVGIRDGKDFTLWSMADYGSPGVSAAFGLALAAIVVPIWALSLGSGRGIATAMVFLAAAEVLTTVVVTLVGVYMLPGVTAFQDGSLRLSFYPALGLLIASLSMTATAAIWWCLVEWTTGSTPGRG